MSESRVFSLNGMDVGAVVSRVEGFFRTEKGMEVQSSKTADGYVMQASQQRMVGKQFQVLVLQLQSRWPFSAIS